MMQTTLAKAVTLYSIGSSPRILVNDIFLNLVISRLETPQTLPKNTGKYQGI
jgi:hypothetical protein